MAQAKLLDYFGFTIGTPEIPEPSPTAVVWGDDFFLLNDDGVNPRYHTTSGFVVDEESRAGELDCSGLTISYPEIPKPFPRVIVKGDDFFLLADADVWQDDETPRYEKTSGFVVNETKERVGCY
jgi:hypothetical protein